MKNRIDAEMDWCSHFDEEDDFAPEFALLESKTESEQRIRGSLPGKAKGMNCNRSASANKQQRDYFGSDSMRSHTQLHRRFRFKR